MFQTIPTERPETPLLDKIEDPSDFRGWDDSTLITLAEELRHFLLYTVGQTGGHFGAGLGVVELTIALHYVFKTPIDHLIWDVGHQTYPHKILTGRREQMHTLRQSGGIAPFPSRTESDYDVFGTGHSSTSMSAALGLALAADIEGVKRQTVVVIGDGAMTAGMAFEALNHIAACQADLLVILNDNAMSISKNVGGLANYFAQNISAGEPDQRLKNDGKNDGTRTPGSIFSDLGFEYTGPIDGHDLSVLIPTLQSLASKSGPRLLHVNTIKGKGYGPAEASPVASHSLTKLEKTNHPQKTKRPTYSALFGHWLCEKAGSDHRLVAITPAMKEGSGMTRFASEFPDRFHDVAIAEQHAVTLAAGLAAGGAKPVVAIYSTFLQRAYDQLIHDVAIQNLDVLFAIDRSGLLEDGPTHSGVFDLSFLRAIPNLTILAPANRDMMTAMLDAAYHRDGPALVRYPRGEADENTAPALEFGRGSVINEGSSVAILSFGSCLREALTVGEAHSFTVADMRFVKPLDMALIDELAASHSLIVTLEENAVMGGAGSAINESLNQLNRQTPCINIGVPDEFIDHDDPNEMKKRAGLSAEQIEVRIREALTRLD